MDVLFEQFLAPGMEYRGKPFWSWNGKLEKEELLRQIHIMKEMGFGGFFMHSRTGLATEYLGEEWFDFIRVCADEAERLGMEAWLYDEDRWPSGTAGGMVTMEPRFRQKYLRMTPVPKEEFIWKEEILAAFTCRLEGVAVFSPKRIYKESRPEEWPEDTILMFTVEEMQGSDFYNGYTYVDTLNRQATERFLELTHQKYKEMCGNRFGKSIKGIFTDEPHRGSVLEGFSVPNSQPWMLLPWTYTLFDCFRERFGYDLVDELPALYLQREGQPVSQVKWHYMELLQEMFLENFAKPIDAWCRSNHLVLTGHILHEDSLTAQAAVSGAVMRYYEWMEYPGVDVLTEGNRNYWIVKQLASAARQLGKKRMLSELYGCTGWQMTLEGHKTVGDWQALFGINLRCHHLSWYTMEGEAKRDYPASILHQSAWWKDYHYVETYFSRLGLMMNQGTPCCDVLVLHPVESVWCQIFPEWGKYLMPWCDSVKKLEEQFSTLFHWLAGARVDFDYGDEEMLSRLYRMGVDSVGAPVLRVGQACYRTVLVSGMTTIHSSTLRILKEFGEAGGKVVFAGDVPGYVDALPSRAVKILARQALHIEFERDTMVAECRELSRVVVDVTDVEGNAIPDIFCQVREAGSRKILLLLNTNREKGWDAATISMNGTGALEEWDCRTGKKVPIPAAGSMGLQWTTGFVPGGERLYVLEERGDAMNAQPSMPPEELGRKPLQGPYHYTLDEPNVCVLDRARYRWNGEEWSREKEILKIDRELRQRTGLPYRGGEMVQPWFAGKQEYPVKGRLQLAFGFVVRDLPADPVELVIESPDIFSVQCNGKPVCTQGSRRDWIDRSFHRISLPAACLQEGPNEIMLETEFHQGVNLEAMYLLGTFGVQLEGCDRILTALPPQLEAGDAVIQGLPFYTGTIRYQLTGIPAPQAQERILLQVPRFAAACIKVRGADDGEEMIAWQPYEADITQLIQNNGVVLEAVMTRRNTFGPLHEVPVSMPGYGPDNFITTGDRFSEGYMLIPSGLLQAPEMIITKQ